MGSAVRRVASVSAAAAVGVLALMMTVNGQSKIACDPDNGGLTLPPGFCALVVATLTFFPDGLASTLWARRRKRNRNAPAGAVATRELQSARIAELSTGSLAAPSAERRASVLPILEVHDVSKAFGALRAVDGVSLTVEKGEIIAIIGRSGSGKSTMLRCVNGLEPIQGGQVRFEGTTVNDPNTDLRKLRQHVGIVFQSFNLFPHLTVEKNITLAPKVVKGMAPTEARALAGRVLAKVGLAEKIDVWPDQLSGGQQQRVAIARSLAMQPTLMLFDEITSALDPELVGEVLKTLEEMAAEGMTMMLVTHEIGFARKVADRVVFMHEGKIWEQGPAADTLAKPRTPELETFLSAVLH